jgi:TrmH family RNA methyltransferase
MFGLKVLNKLNQKKYRSEYGCFLVEGKKGVMDALNSKQEIIQLVMTRQFADQEEKFWQNQEVSLIDTKDFNRLADTVTPSGIAAVIKIPNYDNDLLEKAKIVAVLEDIRDPGNLGTMIRTADWFGIDALVLLGGADPYQAKVVRSSMGSIFNLPILIAENTREELSMLKRKGFKIIVTRPELADSKAEKPALTNKIALVFGNESRGTSQEIDALADEYLSIPKYGQAESLNVAVSFGIIIHDIKTK